MILMSKTIPPPLPEKEPLAPMHPALQECYNKVVRKYKGKIKKKVEGLLRTLNELWQDDFYRSEAEKHITDIKEALDNPGSLQGTIASIRKLLKIRLNQ